jgi:hypothetical protein
MFLMKRLALTIVLTCVFASAMFFRGDYLETQAFHEPLPHNAATAANASFLKALNQIRFVENRGQLPEDVIFSASLAQGQVLFYRDKVEYHILSEQRREDEDNSFTWQAGFLSHKRKYAKKTQAWEENTFTVRYKDSNKNANPIGAGIRQEKVNYFIGSKPSDWCRDAATFDTLIYRNIYDGIDLLFFDGGGKLKYDFVVSPGASYEKIRTEYDGIDSLSITESGDLSFHIGSETHIEEKPCVCQMSYNEKDICNASFRILSRNAAGYQISGINPSLPLVIDPVYSTMIGGCGNDGVDGVLHVTDSVCVVIINTRSKDMITDTSSFHQAMKGTMDIYLVSINIYSRVIQFSTYLGGSGTELSKLIFNKGENLLIIGGTNSSDFPITSNAFQKTIRSEPDCFITLFDSKCHNLLFSSYLGGSGLDEVEDACLDSSGILHLIGWTDSDSDFPRTSGAVQKSYAGGGDDAFYTKIRIDNPKILYSTFLGGYDYDEARDICLDKQGNAIICGYTSSPDFPVRGNALQSTIPCVDAGFITKIDSSGTRIEYSSFFGGSMNTFLESVTATNDGDFVFLGQTYARDIATTPGVFQPNQGNADTNYFCFDLTLLRLDSAFKVEWCSYLGGTSSEYAVKIRMMSEDIAVASTSLAIDYPTINPLQSGPLLEDNVAFSLINGTGTSLLFSTLWGGSDYDFVNMMYIHGRKVYICGCTASVDYPVSFDAIKQIKTGETDGLLLILDMDELVVDAERTNETQPSELIVSQNYPNPFSHDGTVIPYITIKPGTVELAVFDANGRIVEITGKDVLPGQNYHKFNRPSLPPGIYYYRMIMNGQIVVMKMVKLE